jgi:hypothetical protein
MKYLIVFLTIIMVNTMVHSQPKVVGTYLNTYGSILTIKLDSTFDLFSTLDGKKIWNIGIWYMRYDTIYFITKIVYDTVEIKNEEGELKDSLILSYGLVPKRRSPSLDYAGIIYLTEQNRYNTIPNMVIKKNRLFPLRKNGKIIRNKFRIPWLKKKHHYFFFKCNSHNITP